LFALGANAGDVFEIEVENYNAGSLFSFQLGFMEYPPILRITSPTDDISLFRDGIVLLDIEIESPAFFITQDVSIAEYILFSLTSEELLFGDFWAQLICSQTKRSLSFLSLIVSPSAFLATLPMFLKSPIVTCASDWLQKTSWVVPVRVVEGARCKKEGVREKEESCRVK
jgi:hypothetical protein